MAAEVLTQRGVAVTVFDRMPSPARKLLLAGRGGLNLTHAEPLERFLSRYDGAAVAGFVRDWPPEALRRWCEALGQGVFVGSSDRVFPRAMKASPLLRAWLARLRVSGVAFRPSHRWTGWEGGRLCFEGQAAVKADVTVLALGGASWPRLGSDGAWVPVLRADGVGVAPLQPANAGFRVAWSTPMRERFAGQPLKRIAAGFAGRWVRGEAMLTVDGIEGGAVYALSGSLREAIARHGAAVLLLDLRPDLSVAELARRVGGPGVSMANALRRGGLSRAAAALVRETAGPGTLAERAKAVALRLVSMQGMERAISTAGGVAWPALEGLMLRARPGTFVAGEMLDWEAPTGGYLLQACFATGRAAGLQAAGWIADGARPVMV